MQRRDGLSLQFEAPLRWSDISSPPLICHTLAPPQMSILGSFADLDGDVSGENQAGDVHNASRLDLFTVAEFFQKAFGFSNDAYCSSVP